VRCVGSGSWLFRDCWARKLAVISRLGPEVGSKSACLTTIFRAQCLINYNHPDPTRRDLQTSGPNARCWARKMAVTIGATTSFQAQCGLLGPEDGCHHRGNYKHPGPVPGVQPGRWLLAAKAGAVNGDAMTGNCGGTQLTAA